MASSDRDKSKQGKGQKPAPQDPIGPKGPRWNDPKPKAPIAIALDYKKGGKFRVPSPEELARIYNL